MEELKLTQEWQKKQADRRRKDHPNFKAGDKVWLFRKNIATTRLGYFGILWAMSCPRIFLDTFGNIMA